MQTQPDPRNTRLGTTLAALIAVMLLVSQNVFCEEPITDSFSLKSEKQPLEEVLKEIGRAGGYTFSIEDAWKDTPISVNFRKLSLDDALKRILANMNYAVIYDSATAIRIVIYGITATDRRSRGNSERYERPEPDVRDIPEAVRVPEPDITDDTSADNQANEEQAEEENDAASPSEPSEQPADSSEEQIGQSE